MSISNIFNSVPGTKQDWKQDWKEDAKEDWKYDWDVTSGDAISLPVNSSLPVISGDPITGTVLTVSTGTWTGSGISYSYAWYKDGSVIAGETANQYTLQEADADSMIYAVVTATNSTGPSQAQTAAFGPIQLGI